MAGKIQNQDVKSEADLTGAGATKASLINDTKIYVTALGLNERLDEAITNGDLSGGGGGTTLPDAFGNASIRLRPTISSFVLQSPDTTKWDITVSTSGVLTVTSGSSGTVTNIKVTKPDTSETSFAISNAGDLSVISPPAGGETLNNNFNIADSNGVAWLLTVNNSNAIIMSTDATLANYFRVTDDQQAVMVETLEPGVQYAKTLNASTLPATPTTVTGCSPWAFYDNGSNKRMIYYDGGWKYVHDNSSV